MTNLTCPHCGHVFTGGATLLVGAYIRTQGGLNGSRRRHMQRCAFATPAERTEFRAKGAWRKRR